LLGGVVREQTEAKSKYILITKVYIGCTW
jgi:hypothetical protein